MASGQHTVWLFAGESRTLSFELVSQSRDGLNVLFSNDNYGLVETITISIDRPVVVQFQFEASDIGDYGAGWNTFVSSGPLAFLDLLPGAYNATITVMNGDGYGVEIDAVPLDLAL
jgi:hypothetical protein